MRKVSEQNYPPDSVEPGSVCLANEPQLNQPWLGERLSHHYRMWTNLFTPPLHAESSLHVPAFCSQRPLHCEALIGRIAGAGPLVTCGQDAIGGEAWGPLGDRWRQCLHCMAWCVTVVPASSSSSSSSWTTMQCARYNVIWQSCCHLGGRTRS